MHKTNLEAYDSGGRVTHDTAAPRTEKSERSSRTGDQQVTLNTEIIFSSL